MASLEVSSSLKWLLSSHSISIIVSAAIAWCVNRPAIVAMVIAKVFMIGSYIRLVWVVCVLLGWYTESGKRAICNAYSIHQFSSVVGPTYH